MINAAKITPRKKPLHGYARLCTVGFKKKRKYLLDSYKMSTFKWSEQRRSAAEKPLLNFKTLRYESATFRYQML